MTDEQNFVNIPEDEFLEWFVNMAREVGSYDDYASPPERGVDSDVEWDWDDVEWDDVAYRPSSHTVEAVGMVDGSYSVKTASATRYPNHKAHPAEYENRSTELAVEIVCELGEGHALDLGDFHIEVIGL